MSYPLVSVWMITYNHEKYIAKALESVLMQKTNFDFEIVIGEDFSTDRTRTIVQEYENRYPGIIKAIYQKKNVGAIPNAYEYTLPFCMGKYLACLEGDDYWTDPLKLQKQVDFLEANPDYSLCFHDAIVLWEDARQPPKNFCSKNQKETTTIEDVIEKYYIPSASMVFRKDAMLPIPDWFNDIYNGDYALHLLLARNGKLKYINKIMSVYYRQKSSLTYDTKITNDFVYNSIVKLMCLFNKETEKKYDNLVQNRIKSINTKNRRYQLKEDHPLYYHLKYPVLSIGKVFRDLGLFIIGKSLKNGE